MIAATIGRLRVFSIYAPNGQAVGSASLRIQTAIGIAACEIVSRKKNLAIVVVCGDFNVAPEDIDVYDANLWRGAIMCSEGERAAFQAIV